MTAGTRTLIRSAAAAVLGAACLYFLRADRVLLRPGLVIWLAALLPVVALAALARRRTDGLRLARDLRTLAPAVVLCACALLYLASSTTDHRWFYLNRWAPAPADPFDALLPRFVVLAACLSPLLALWTRRLWPLLLLPLLALQWHALDALLSFTGGLPVYRDDHPSFLLRLQEFRETFPRCLNYMPYWNGGTLHHAGAETGMHGVGMLLWPLWLSRPVHEVYTLGLGLLFIVMVPFAAAGSVRLMRGDALASWAAAFLALGVSQYFFLWLLNYGTIGALMTTCALLPFSACVYRVVWLRRAEPWLALLLIVSGWLLVQWPPGALMAAALALPALLSGRRLWSARTLCVLALGAAVIGLLYLRPLLVILGKGSAVIRFVSAPDPHAAAGHAPAIAAGFLANGWTFLWNCIKEGHPLLIFLGLLGCGFLRRRHLRRWFIPALLFFALLAGWGRLIFPKLQLERMAIPMFVVAVIPAAFLLAQVLRARAIALAPVRAAMVALLIVGAYSVGDTYGRRGRVPFNAMPPDVPLLAAWIQADVPPGARLCFAGPNVHTLGRGHVAYLPILAGREMMACDYYHFPTTYVEYQYPPRGFREDAEAFLRFAALYNVSHVITRHAYWRDFFLSRPDVFAALPPLVPGTPDLWFRFRLQRELQPILGAAGQIRARFNRIDVTLAGPAESCVLPYNWIEGLSVEAPATLFPHEAENGVRLIGVRPAGRTAFRVRYRNWL